MLLFILLFNLFPVDSTLSMHDFHLSKTEINYNTEQQALQFMVHTFIDDIELAMQSYEPLEYKLLQDDEHVLTDSVLVQYIKEHLIVATNEDTVSYNYIGKETSDDLMGLWAYFEVENLSPFESINVKNSILMDTYDDQKNIINIKVDNKSKAFHILSLADNTKQIDLD